jgi:hypothetical protein
MATPILLLLLPTFGSYWASQQVHVVAAAIAVPLALFLLIRGRRYHQQWWPLVLGSLGCAGLLLGLIPAGGAESAADAMAHCTEAGCCPTIVETEAGGWSLSMSWQAAVTFVGSLFLVAGHAGNMRCCPNC